MNNTKSVKQVKSAIRTMSLFQVFAEHQRPLTLGELAHYMQAPKSSCYELIHTLAGLGYITLIDGGKSYYPSRRLSEMVDQINLFNPIKERVQFCLKKLRDETGETVFVGRIQGLQAVYSEVFEGTHSIRYTANSGDVKPLHASALGRALLANVPESEQSKLLSEIKLTRFTEQTITRKKQLKEQLDQEKYAGVSITYGDSSDDIAGIAAPLLLNAHMLAVGIAGPNSRVEVNVDRYKKNILRTIGQILNY
ncbi:IclR family transcriptional regulator [Halioxenophilus aromaticivorans]|uniref:IclR family transcriptional regulator n=1 Tax=Halioxenophilus aromaticivorans TaxID=1306992 RepID=A0AAV3TW52_9ALTE